MSLGLIVVEVCERNLLASIPLEELEDQYPEIAVQRTPCLFMCHLCRAVPYAMVNSKRVYARTVNLCLHDIQEAAVKEINDFMGIK
ncbi:DUF1450 domain-containing protein [Paenibacillus oceani]|uniref:DUF1450 domain-containing protein n=1 Tax=Paenibacillus oceani TaxID=2772510 RepID=A0A927CAX0_9BACL|nr:DUF1450 domain-containing protein [Paenibacillus oceani]MBD2862911.1 DUF1450 domain-containing protein [Paenibacillus oceani]